MKIKTYSLSRFLLEIEEYNKIKSKEYVDKIKELEDKIQGLNAVVITLKDFRDRKLSEENNEKND